MKRFTIASSFFMDCDTFVEIYFEKRDTMEQKEVRKVKKRIYIAEDEKHTRNIIKLFLEKANYQVQDFENGDALYQAFLQQPADLVVLDIMMPGRDKTI